MASSTWDPRAEYASRLETRKAKVEDLCGLDARISNARLATFVGGVAIVAASVYSSALPIFLVAIPIMFFVVLVVLHDRSLRAKGINEDAVRYYERALARIEDRWHGTGEQGANLAPAKHLYAADLDLFGEGSLFELLCTARTSAGEATLGAWLCEPATANEIRARQDAIEELRHRLDLREDLALLGGATRATVHPRILREWAEASPALRRGAAQVCSRFLTFAAILSILGWAFFGFNVLPLAVVLVVEVFWLRWMKRDVARVLRSISEPARELEIFAVVLKRLEQETFKSTKLRDLREALKTTDGYASVRIRHLSNLLVWAEAPRNAMFAPLGFALLWSIHFAYALETWRAANGESVGRWLATLGEFEALSSLAAYAYEHPHDPFAEIEEKELVFDGQALGHPLIPDAMCKRNDMRLGANPALVMISGSNMSGKSTMLRVVGVNTVLGLAGAPVRAERLRLSPVTLGASMRIVDSIQSGTSHFYAEIQRLHDLMQATKGPLPLLFLVDEMFHGTNSHDRRIGAHTILKSLLERRAIGLVTTHDLALTESVKEFGAKAANMHFEDHLEGDRLAFDYKIRPGVVQKSNALALMRAIGLDV